MALINGSPASSALLADAALHARHRLELAEQFFALSIEAINAPLEAYDEVLESLWGDEQETAALRALRAHLEGAEVEDRLGAPGPGQLPDRSAPARPGAPGGRRGGTSGHRRAPVGHPESRLRATGRGSSVRAGSLDRGLPQRRRPGRSRHALARLGRAGAPGRAPGHGDAPQQRVRPAALPQSARFRARLGGRGDEPVRVGGRFIRRGGADRGRADACCRRASTIPRTTCPRRPSAPTGRSAGRRSAWRRRSRSSPSSRARRSMSPTAGRPLRSSPCWTAVRSLFAPVDGTSRPGPGRRGGPARGAHRRGGAQRRAGDRPLSGKRGGAIRAATARSRRVAPLHPRS